MDLYKIRQNLENVERTLRAGKTHIFSKCCQMPMLNRAFLRSQESLKLRIALPYTIIFHILWGEGVKNKLQRIFAVFCRKQI